MSLRAVLSFGVVFDSEEECPYAKFNVPEEYEEDWVEWICDSGVVEAHRCGSWESDVVILCIPDTYISIEWGEVLDVDQFMEQEIKCSLGDILRFDKWLKKYGFKEVEGSWLMSTYYG